MSWTPTDEQALVKKIAHVLAQGYGTSGNKKVLDIDERVARAVLVAVGPTIAAQAWDEGMALGHNDPRRLLDKWAKNPYRQEAGR